MPIGYLITTVGVGLFAVLAVTPPRRPRWLGMAAFRVGLPAAELPLILLVYLVASTALELIQSGVGTAVAWMALAIAAASAVALGSVVWRMTGARREVDRALQDGLGVALPARRRRGMTAPALLAPLPLGRGGVERIADIPYGDAGMRNLLDVYRPPSRPERCPTLLHLHGGGFVRGHKSREALPLLHRLVQRGWVCASANYRLHPAPYAERLADARSAIAWLGEEGQAYGADPTRLVVAGSSAGAHLVSMEVLGSDGSDLDGLSVAGVVCLHGYFGPAGEVRVSPFDHVGEGAPPFFIAHGDRDTVAPVESARRFAAALRAEGTAPVVYVELRGAQHAFDLFDSLRHESLIDGIEAFAARIGS